MDSLKKCIIWLEDNFHEDSLSALGNYIETRQNACLRLATGVMQLRRNLDEAELEAEVIKGIILDIIVHGRTNLSPFNRPDIQWAKGSASVGEKLIRFIFRSKKDNPWNYLANVPILVLSVKAGISETEFTEFGKNITVIQKYEADDWDSRVKKWIEKALNT